MQLSSEYFSFKQLPSSFLSYLKVLTGSKPLLAAAAHAGPAITVVAQQVRINKRHLARYQQVCGLRSNATVPLAYLHVLAMPLHMRIFAAQSFPVKVLGLVHLRNVIRQYEPLQLLHTGLTVRLIAECHALRETGVGQEYDLITRCEQDGRVVWEEVSTMLARRWAAGARPVIERATQDAANTLAEEILRVPKYIGRQYARVSGDFNPIHLADFAAHWFKFKQTVVHGMWSIARCAALAEPYLPPTPLQLNTQFKLPLYLPGEALLRCQRAAEGIEITLSTPKGHRLHLSMQASSIAL